MGLKMHVIQRAHGFSLADLDIEVVVLNDLIPAVPELAALHRQANLLVDDARRAVELLALARDEQVARASAEQTDKLASLNPSA